MARSTRSTASPCRLLDVQELLVRLRHRPGDARHRRAGTARRDPPRRTRGAPRLHRGGGRRPQAPQAQGKGAPQARRDAGQPQPAAGPHLELAPPAQAARPAGGGRPPGQRSCRPTLRDSRLRLLADDLTGLRTALDGRGRRRDRAASSAGPASRPSWPTPPAARPSSTRRSPRRRRGWPARRRPGTGSPGCGSGCAGPSRSPASGSAMPRPPPTSTCRAATRRRWHAETVADPGRAGRGRPAARRPTAAGWPTPRPSGAGSRRLVAEEDRALTAARQAVADRREGLARLHGEVTALRTRATAAEDEIGRLTVAWEAAKARAATAARRVRDRRERGRRTRRRRGRPRLAATRRRPPALAEAEERLSALQDEEREVERAAQRRRGPPRRARARAGPQGRRGRAGRGPRPAARRARHGRARSCRFEAGFEAAVAAALGAAADAVAVTVARRRGRRDRAAQGATTPDAPGCWSAARRTTTPSWPVLPDGTPVRRLTSSPRRTRCGPPCVRLLERTAIVADVESCPATGRRAPRRPRGDDGTATCSAPAGPAAGRRRRRRCSRCGPPTASPRQLLAELSHRADRLRFALSAATEEARRAQDEHDAAVARAARVRRPAGGRRRTARPARCRGARRRGRVRAAGPRRRGGLGGPRPRPRGAGGARGTARRRPGGAGRASRRTTTERDRLQAQLVDGRGRRGRGPAGGPHRRGAAPARSSMRADQLERAAAAERAARERAARRARAAGAGGRGRGRRAVRRRGRPAAARARRWTRPPPSGRRPRSRGPSPKASCSRSGPAVRELAAELES